MRTVTAHVVRGVALAASVGVLAGCGGSSPKLPAAAKSAFLTSCEQRTPPSACNCMFNYIQAHVSVATFKAAQAQVDAGHAPGWLISAALTCRKSAGAASGSTT